MKSLIIVSFLFLICGCNVDKHNIERQHTYNYKYQGELAKDCATLFPATDSIGKPIYTQVNNIDYTGAVDSLKILADGVKKSISWFDKLPPDTITLYENLPDDRIAIQAALINALVNKINDLKATYKPCKPDTLIKTHYVTDMAKLKVWQDAYKIKADSLAIVNHDLAETKKKKKTWMWATIGAGVLIFGFLAIKIYLLISGGWIKKVI